MVTRWGLGDGSNSTPAGKIVRSTAEPRKGCTPPNNCGCGPPAFCNKWILYFAQFCEGGEGKVGDVATSYDLGSSYTMPGYIFVDLSSIPTEVADPPPQSVNWKSTFGGSDRPVSVPGTTTIDFTLADTDTCPIGDGVVNPFSSGCDRHIIFSTDGSGGFPADCAEIPVPGRQFLCDPKALHNVPGAPITSTVVPSTTVDTPSDGHALNSIGTLFVVDTTGFPSSGSVVLNGGFGTIFATYTGKTGTSLTGFSCTSPTVIHTGDGAAPVLHLSDATILVGDTTGYLSSGTFWVNTGGPVYQEIAYTGKTGTSFTGCTGGPGTIVVNGWSVYGVASGSIDPACPDPVPSGGITVSFYYDYVRVDGAHCHLSEAALVDFYWPY